MNVLAQLFQRLGLYSSTLSFPQKVLYTGGVLIFAGALASVFYLANRPDYTTLYSGLAQNDMGEIAQTLKVKKIAYRITDGSIEVPKEQLYEIRLTLASEGVPRGSGLGFEIFDQQKLGSTEFVQKVNYQRALQGELARTINGMSEVQESRVHLVLPEDSLFKDDQKPASAAVVLKLRAGAKMESKQLQGITHLVASTVRGLTEDRITVISTDGQVLFKKNSQDQPSQMSNLQMEHKQRMEEDVRQKVQSMLEQVLGQSRALARVTLDLDFNQVQIAEETYNPDSAVVRSQQRSIETADGKELGAKGNPDAPINVESKLLQNAPQSDGAKGKQSSRQREVLNYEINKVNKQITQMPGNVKKISAAIIVDGQYEMKPGQDGKQKSTFVGRSPEELKTIEDLVKKAVGYNEARGDQISVSNIPFAPEAAGPEMVEGENKWIQLLRPYQKLALNAVLAILALVFVVRPFMRKFNQVADEIKSLPPPRKGYPPQHGQQYAEGDVSGLLEQETGTPVSLRKKTAALVQHDPARATEIIRGWLNEEA
jgi:flagellar M-ring protein FliF